MTGDWFWTGSPTSRLSGISLSDRDAGLPSPVCLEPGPRPGDRQSQPGQGVLPGQRVRDQVQLSLLAGEREGLQGGQGPYLRQGCPGQHM